MAPVQEALGEWSRTLAWRDVGVPLVGTVSGELLWRGAEIGEELVEQIARPVQWVGCVQRLVAEGCTTLLELGAGGVLTKLVGLIAPQITALCLDTPAKVASYAQARGRAAAVSVGEGGERQWG
jgi:[acyl-carrier-protein] S-malonyltransferase